MAAENVNIVVEGVEDEILENIQSSLSLEKQKEHPRLTANRIKSLHEKANEEIKRALQALGYYKPVIKSKLDEVEGVWQALYTIDAGAPLIINQFDLKFTGDAENDPEFQKLHGTLPLKSGDILHHGLYESSKNNIQRLAAAHGYLDSKFSENKVEVDLKKNTATIKLHFDSGVRYKIGKVRYSESPINKKSLQQFQNFQEGDPYENRSLIKLQQTLSGTDYFESVQVRPVLGEATNHTIPILVKLAAKKRNRYTAGAGFGTDTGPRIKFGWINRYVNDRGHRAGADIKLSPVLSTLSTNYTIPHFRKKDASLGFSGTLWKEDTDTSKSSAINLGINHRQKRWGWDEALSLSYLFEDFEIGNEERSSALLMPGISWSKKKTDSETYTKNGYRIDMSIRAASESILSDVSLIQASLNGKYIRSISEDGRIIVRGNIGATQVNEFEKLPTSLRYFAGGDNSIRGFDYEDLGPEDKDGNVVGGKYLIIGSFEYEHRIKEKWSIASFIDAGNAFNNFGDDFEYGAGIGIRWLSPVGLVRVDLAMGFSDPDKPIRLHIMIGPDL